MRDTRFGFDICRFTTAERQRIQDYIKSCKHDWSFSHYDGGYSADNGVVMACEHCGLELHESEIVDYGMVSDEC
jgi:hypothetical protein